MAKEHFKVRFFRVTASDGDGNHVEIGPIDWKKQLEDEAKLGIDDRKLVLDKVLCDRARDTSRCTSSKTATSTSA